MNAARAFCHRRFRAGEALDPRYALPYVGLAHAFCDSSVARTQPAGRGSSTGRSPTRMCARPRSDLSEAHAALALTLTSAGRPPASPRAAAPSRLEPGNWRITAAWAAVALNVARSSARSISSGFALCLLRHGDRASPAATWRMPKPRCGAVCRSRIESSAQAIPRQGLTGCSASFDCRGRARLAWVTEGDLAGANYAAGFMMRAGTATRPGCWTATARHDHQVHEALTTFPEEARATRPRLRLRPDGRRRRDKALLGDARDRPAVLAGRADEAAMATAFGHMVHRRPMGRSRH